MIPRFKPCFDGAEITAAFRPSSAGDVERFEQAFAAAFESADAVAFPYGRTALSAFLQATGVNGAEVITPSYTCSVVAHAIVLSGNTPRFVDNSLVDYNMDLEQVADAINERTGAVIATHLFGYPVDVDRLSAIVKDAERCFGRKIWIVQDCAHAFGARWKGRLVCCEGDAGLFGMNISKVLSSIFGGMLTFEDRALAGRVRQWRDSHLTSPRIMKSLLRVAYLAATYPAFQSSLYGLIHWLQYETPLLDRVAKAYHLDDEIRFPPDAGERMLPVEARVGLAQLRKYPSMIERRRQHATRYTEALQGVPGWVLPPVVPGATYSHYPVRVPDREAVVNHFSRHGVHLGEVIEYSVAHLSSYARSATTEALPNSLLCSQHMVNLPVHPQLTDAERERVIEIARKVGSHA